MVTYKAKIEAKFLIKKKQSNLIYISGNILKTTSW